MRGTKDTRRQNRQAAPTSARRLLDLERRIARCTAARDAMHQEQDRLRQRATKLRLSLTAKDAADYAALAALERAAR